MKQVPVHPGTTDPSHYAASHDAFGRVLVQLGDSYGEQLRLSLTPSQARHFAATILEAAEQADLDQSAAVQPSIAVDVERQTGGKP